MLIYLGKFIYNIRSYSQNSLYNGTNYALNAVWFGKKGDKFRLEWI